MSDQLPWSVFAIEVLLGTAGILSNVYSLYYNFRRNGFPRQLYIVLNSIDLIVCVMGALYMIMDSALFFYVFANQISGIWTCIIGGARLLAMSRPFYQINKKVFWSISTMLLVMGTIPQGTLMIKYHMGGNDNFLSVILWISACFNIGVILVNLVLTLWTGILLNRKPDVAAERDQERRKAAITVFLLGVVFLLTNISAVVTWALHILFLVHSDNNNNNNNKYNDEFFYLIYVVNIVESMLLIFIVVNAAINPLVILRKQLKGLCRNGRLQLVSVIRSMFRRNIVSP